MLLTILYAVLVILCARRASWRPIGITIGASHLLDLLALGLPLPARLDLALWFATPVLSAWCAWRVLERRPRAGELTWLCWGVCAAVALWAPLPALWWGPLPAVARLASIAAQVEAARVWARSDRVGSTAEVAAVGLLGGDALSALGPAGVVPGPWAPATAQAIVVALGLLVLRTRGGSRSDG